MRVRLRKKIRVHIGRVRVDARRGGIGNGAEANLVHGLHAFQIHLACPKTMCALIDLIVRMEAESGVK